MEAYQREAIRAQLVDRRQRLTTAVNHVEESTHLVQLLQQVDAALERMDHGSYGLCKACHDPVETDRLMADPLMCFCLDHLTANQKETLQQDLELASKIQAALLPPRHLDSGDWEASYHYEALGAVGGDYCDLLPSESCGGVFFAVGDVSGKGVAASLLMAHAHAIFRSLAATDLRLDRLVERANRIFCQSSTPSAFATLVCGWARPSGRVEICNAGHCTPLLFPANGNSRIEANGVPLGLFAGSQYSMRRLQFAPGQGLLLYTDGVTESRNSLDEEYGVERLAAFLARQTRLDPRELVRACRQELDGFSPGSSRADDVTIMAIRRKAGGLAA